MRQLLVQIPYSPWTYFFRMAKLRRDREDSNPQPFSPAGKQLRIVASGTLFLTHTLSLPCHPAPSAVIRAHSVEKTRGGSANMVCFLLLHFVKKDLSEKSRFF